MKRELTIALAGNPNSGKTTLFNALTGSHRHVGNYPGVTVEKKEGWTVCGETQVRLVDLPGTYSLTAYSQEELVARDFVVEEKPDAVIDVVDASNIERNLYLAVQFKELGVPLVIALNMVDIAIARGVDIDTQKLSELLGSPVIKTVANRGEGLGELVAETVEWIDKGLEPGRPVTYGDDLETEIAKVQAEIDQDPALGKRYPPRWLAVKLLEGDKATLEHVENRSTRRKEIFGALKAAVRHLAWTYEEEPENIIADGRYGFVAGAVRESVRLTMEGRRTFTDRIDDVVTHRILGIPIFLFFMWCVFSLTFTLGNAPMGWIESLFGWLGDLFTRVIPPGPIQSLLVDGVIGGVGGVVVFLPNIVLLFMAISILEDSGYMARGAFVMDRAMHWVGLHGKSFIPLLIGFGCNVPAIMAARTLESRRDRLVTILIIPLMSCGARLPVYVLLIGAFFPTSHPGSVLFIIYALGVLTALCLARVFRSTLFRGESTPFVMELPSYHVPTLKGVLIHMWERAGQYLKKAGTVILAASVIIWFLCNFPAPPDEARFAGQREAARAEFSQAPEKLAERLEEIKGRESAERLKHSYAAAVGHFIEPAIRPLGFDWRIGVALFSGFAAKEVVVSTMGTIWSLGDSAEHTEGLREALRRDRSFSPLLAATLIIVILYYVPCLAALTVIWKETGRKRWPIFVALYTTALAWLMGLLVYQGGRLLGLG